MEAREGRGSTVGKPRGRIYGCESSVIPIAPSPFSSPNAKDGIGNSLVGRSSFCGVDSLGVTPDGNDMTTLSTGSGQVRSGVGAGAGDPRRTAYSYRNKRARRTGTLKR